MKERSNAQRQRQHSKFRNKGKYAKVNPCQVCDKSAGVSYLSHPLTDSVSPKGEPWGDLAICLCKKCSEETQDMKEPIEFYDYVDSLRK